MGVYTVPQISKGVYTMRFCLFFIFGFKCAVRIAPPPDPPAIVRPLRDNSPVWRVRRK